MSGPLTAYICAAARTPVGRNRGSLSKIHPADLGAIAVDACVQRSGCPPEAVDDVIIGCVSQFGAQAVNIGRTVVLSSKVLPETCPGTTVDRQCGSSQQAIHFAAQAVMSGTQDVVVAGGVEVMSLLPIGCVVMDAMKVEPSRGTPYNGKGFTDKYGKKIAKTGAPAPSQFIGAELLVHKHKLTREGLDGLAVESHRRAAAAIKAGTFRDEIVPVPIVDKDGNATNFTTDECPRPATTMDAISKLKTLHPMGKLTAATASQIADGAAAVLIANDRAVAKYNLKPLAKIVTMSVIGCDPIVMLEGPIFATKAALKRSGLSLTDIGLYEVNEAFASVPLSWATALKADTGKLNVNGSGISLGHALGGTGARIFTTLVHEMHRRKERYGLVSICEGGGTANATIIERVDPAEVAKIGRGGAAASKL